MATVGHLTGKHIVEHEECRLTAIGNGDIGGGEIPAKLLL